METVRILVGGAGGAGPYALLPRIADGDLLGLDQEVEIVLLETQDNSDMIHGIAMELSDCAFQLLRGVSATCSWQHGLAGVHLAIFGTPEDLCLGHTADLVTEVEEYFKTCAIALNKHANYDIKVAVAGPYAKLGENIIRNRSTRLSPENVTAVNSKINTLFPQRGLSLSNDICDHVKHWLCDMGKDLSLLQKRSDDIAHQSPVLTADHKKHHCHHHHNKNCVCQQVLTASPRL